MGKEPPHFWIYFILGPFIAFLGLYWSFATLSRWADQIGGLGFTMNPQYTSMVTREGLTIPFLCSGTILLLFYSFVAIQLFRAKRFGYFLVILGNGLVTAAVFLFTFMVLAIMALD